jgi:enterobacterial common antigen flippase
VRLIPPAGGPPAEHVANSSCPLVAPLHPVFFHPLTPAPPSSETAPVDLADATEKSQASYGQILRSSSIIGGATGINYVIGMVRTKAVAVLLGPSGIGLVGLYVSITGLVSTIAQLGIDQSGVREVAEANGGDDPQRVARVVKTLRRVCWFTGILGWILTVALAWPLSQWTFGSSERMWPVAILGITVLIGAVTGGQSALLQGMRRIGDLARIQVLSAIITTLIAVGLYAWMGERGIIPVIILSSVVQLGLSWYFSRRIQISVVPQSWTETAATSKRLVGLGAAFMYGALLYGVVGVFVRSLIVRELGLDANGIYQAAWGLSGMFAGFILGAMGADFYPRLTAVAHDNEQINRLVNEQTEIGILLALPGLLGTLAFAPWLMKIFYSTDFLSGADLLPWFVCGVFVQVIITAVGFIQRAKGATRWIIIGQTEANILFLVLCFVLIPKLGLQGVAYAWVIQMLIHGIVVFLIGKHLSGFIWTRSVCSLCAVALLLVLSGFKTQSIPGTLLPLALGGIITFIGGIISLCGITARLGSNHRLTRAALRVPGVATCIHNLKLIWPIG